MTDEKDKVKRYTVLPVSADLVEEAALRLVPQGSDYSRNLVVFPGKRPAHFLRKGIARRLNASYVPPVILSMEEFVDYVYERLTPLPDRKIDTIDAVALLFEIHRGMDTRLGGREFLSLDVFLSLGIRIYSDIEELLIERVACERLRALEPFMEAPLPPQTNASLQLLSVFYEHFYPALTEAHFSSRSQRYCLVSDRITEEDLPFDRIIVAGFYALTESERRLFVRFLLWRKAQLLFQDGPGLWERLKNLGISCEDCGKEASSSGDGPRLHFYKSPDSHGQIFALTGILKAEMDGAEDIAGREETVIVLPGADTLFPVLHHALPVIPAENYNISLGYPMERTPVWGFVHSLMQLIMSVDGERLYVPDYLKFVLHPYTKNIYFDGRSEVTRILFHTIEEFLLADRTKRYVDLKELEEHDGIHRLIGERMARMENPPGQGEISAHLKTIHDRLIRTCFRFYDVKDFAEKMSGVLMYVYDHSSARLHPFFHPFAESFVDQLALFRNSLLKNLAFSERNSYFHFFRRYIAQCFTPFEGTPLRGVQVLGFLETRNIRFRHVYIIGANEDVIPDTRKEDSLIPFKVRQIMGLSTYLERDQLSAYYFETLVKGAEDAHIFFVENDRKEKSRFVERLLWEQQKKDGTDRTSRYVKSVSYDMSLANAGPLPIPKTQLMVDYLEGLSYNATSLDVYLNCPLQFYYRYVLALEKREEAQGDIERLDIGRLVHRVLLTYFRRRMGEVLTGELLDRAEMEDVVKSVCEDLYGSGPIGPAYLLRRQVARQMEAFLRYYQIPAAQETHTRILYLEQALKGSVGPFRFRGILDRVEMRGERLTVIDYKTGASPGRLAINFDRLDPADRAGWSKAIGSLQLPFYLLLLEQHTGKKAEEMDALFLLLGKVRLDDGVELPLFRGSDERKACFEAAKQIILRLTEEIVDPAVPFNPNYKAKDSCNHCDYRYMCGTQWEGG